MTEDAKDHDEWRRTLVAENAGIFAENAGIFALKNVASPSSPPLPRSYFRNCHGSFAPE